jgi:hypothetical protein
MDGKFYARRKAKGTAEKFANDASAENWQFVLLVSKM